ncbi:MAG: hypothetical protein H6725_03385 [Sandaracinaceae bacterium]|nr:hypothetical protein [Sandaracinaceae bacterium]
MRHSAKITLLTMLFGMASLPSGVSAQGWLADRGATQGHGFQAGPLTLHMGFGAEFGYDNNVYLEDTNRQDSLLMRLTGHLRATTLQEEESNPLVTFNGGVNASFYHFFADSGRDNVGLGADVTAHFRPGSRVSFKLADHFTRTIRPFVDGLPNLRYARDNNTVDAELRFRSDSDVLRAFIGYRLDFDFFEDRGPGEFAYAGSLTHALRTGVYWAFLPNTGFVYEGQVERVNYGSQVGAGSLVSDAWRVRQELGLNGAITPAVSVTGMLGYSGGFFDQGADYGIGRDALTARLEGRFRPRDNVQLKVGYQRRFNQSFIGNFARHDRLYLGGQLMLGGVFMTGIDFAAARTVTGSALAADGTFLDPARGSRRAWRLTTDVYAEYRATQWLAVTLQLQYLADFTSFTFTTTSPLVDPNAAYSKFQAWLGLRVFY